ACTPEKIEDIDDEEEPIYYVVTFDAQGGTSVASVTVLEGSVITVPDEPTRAEYIFKFWYITDPEVRYIFDTPVTSNITLKAAWEKEAEPEEEIPTTDLIYEDIEAVENQLFNSYYDLNLITK